MTERLYYKNSYLTEFEAKVEEQYRKGDAFAVILNQTAFYPTSGGQMGDRGFLADQRVLDVVESGDEVVHVIAHPLEKQIVTGKVDWERRFDFMQQHTGFHILAQSFLRVLRVQTLSSHLGEEVDTIDVAADSLSWDQIKKVESLANQIIWENRSVSAYFVTKKEAEQCSLRKPPKFFNKPIRLVNIEEFDLDPCGGTHVRATGEVGAIKILSWEKVREAIRCTFVAGNRALREFQHQNQIIQRLAQIFSAPKTEIVAQAETLRKSLKEKEKGLKKFREKLLEAEASALVLDGAKIQEKLWIREFPKRSAGDIRFLALKLSRELDAVPVFYSTCRPSYIVVAVNPEANMDLTPAISVMKELLQGKGGGGKFFFEFTEIDSEKLSEAFSRLRELIK